MRFLLNILLWATIPPMTAWGVGALYFSRLLPVRWRTVAAATYGVATVGAFALAPDPHGLSIATFAVFAILVSLFLRIRASNHRDWQPEVSVTPHATLNGDLVTIHGVRNFDYRSATVFTPRWEVRSYDLRKLDSADIIAVYWAGRAIAHLMVSFGFEGKDYLAVSIETRKEKLKDYSTLAGFFRQYELYYVVADERDVIRVRTNYRKPEEEVHLYRVRTPSSNIRRIFLDYIQKINDLHVDPSFYNTLTTNCTTNILMHSRMNPDAPRISWKVLLSGYVPHYLYELGRIDTTRPFRDLEKLCHINERAYAADKDSEFSRRIRIGLPTPAPLSVHSDSVA